MFCEYCGKEINGNGDFCPNCGMAIAKGPDDSVASAIKGVTERIRIPSLNEPNLHIPKPAWSAPVQDSAVMDPVLAEGEVVIRKYNCANVKGAKGYLTVTNKRLMFNAAGGGSRLDQEVTLSSVSGLTCYKGRNVILPLVIIGGLLALMGLYAMTSYSLGVGAGLVFLAIGALMIFLGIRTAFLIAVYAKDVQISPIVVGEGPKSFIGNSALLAIASMPTPDTDIMLMELGALVQDLQSMGDLAIEKWQSK